MLPYADMMQCQNLAVSPDVMQHVVQVESAANPYAIGVVGGRLVRQPQNLAEAVATARMLDQRGFNFSVGLAQVNRYNLGRMGISDYTQAFDRCTNLRAGARILSECHARAGGDWGKAFSCYYSGNFSTGFEHGYVQKIFASIQGGASQAAPVQLAAAGALPARASAPSTRVANARIVASQAGEAPLSYSAAPVAAATPAPTTPERQPAFAAAMAGADNGVVQLTPAGPRYPQAAAVAPAAPTQYAQLDQQAAAPPAPAGAHPAADTADNAFVF